ncbi:DDE-type integrase/transposase/recombinase [Pseudomonas sp. JM0905a]|uniref:Mu transposase C-terminal domain-containing protein n=1 Tax=Pseudomonas sp. JM0905a TaxID=2772484 RepID=UPI0016855683|nr:Mu transposase C-terminal domain-containing protein [Pseudomonas sp. JM0905a]MBD2835538.1 DDE-type integrase/transposase/recombinase [Pseudomonas sp. JM0905a]
MSILVNDIVEPLADSVPFKCLARVLWVDQNRNSIYLMMLEKPMKKPWRLSFDQLAEWLSTNEVRVAKESVPAFMVRDETEVSPWEVEIRDRNWRLIEPLIQASLDGSIFHGDCFPRSVNDQVRKVGCHKSQIYRLIFRFWYYGQSKNSLLQNRTNAGAPGVKRTYRNGAKPGRPIKYLGVNCEPEAKIIDDTDLRCIRIGFSLYASDRKITLAKAYRKMLEKFYSYRCVDLSSEYLEGDTKVEIYPVGSKPTIGQFKYWGSKIYTDIDILRGRTSYKNWQKDKRALRGRAQDNLHGPGHRFEVDATVADIYLVSEFNRNWVIGRPIIYAVLDTCSRMVVGLHVALEGPSWNSARHALYNAFTEKKIFCAEYGVEIDATEWPCHHLPFEVMVDRGELNSQAAEKSLVESLGIDISVAPPFRPDWKSVVEQYFHISNKNICISWIPGAVLGRARERGERDYREDAVLTLREFTKIIIGAALLHNKTFWNPELLTNEMIADEVEPTPLGIWGWALSKQRIESRAIPAQLLYLNLLPRVEAKVRAGGIEVNGMMYICNQVIDQQWLERARNKGVIRVSVWYDPNCSWHVWIKNSCGEFVRCSLVPSDERFKGYRVEEVVDMMAIYKKPSPRERESKLQSQVDLDMIAQGTVDHAVAEKKKKPKPKSKKERVSYISENRRVEMLQERERLPVPTGLRDSSMVESDVEIGSVEVVDTRLQKTIAMLRRERG